MKSDMQLLRLGAWLLLAATVVAGPLLVWIVHLLDNGVLVPNTVWNGLVATIAILVLCVFRPEMRSV